MMQLRINNSAVNGFASCEKWVPLAKFRSSHLSAYNHSSPNNRDDI
jgi:hypothetical protein